MNHWWRRMWERAPRQLRFTRSGRVLVFVALASGFAAINTGNNLLFLGWGLVLSAIVLSGVLSEASLRWVQAGVVAPAEARAGEPVTVPLTLRNNSQLVPAYAIAVGAQLAGPEGVQDVAAPGQLRLAPKQRLTSRARFTPQRRGCYQVTALYASTQYPFGFFDKSRRFGQAQPVQLCCFPQRVDVQRFATTIASHRGVAPAQRAGPGEDFFSLRPFREGDDLRRVHWKRSARTGRWVVIESEATMGQELTLVLALGAAEHTNRDHVEYAIAVLGSLCEALLHKGYRVGVVVPGALLPADGGANQRWRVLHALAVLDVDADAPLPPLSRGGAGWHGGGAAGGGCCSGARG